MAENNNEDYVTISDDEMSSFAAPITGEASYFEKMQNFQPFIKDLRIRYLHAKQIQKDIGSKGRPVFIIEWEIPKSLKLGINRRGLEWNIQYITDRLSSNTVLSNFKQERVDQIIYDIMKTWAKVMKYNYEVFELEPATFLSLRITLSDFFETTFSRAVENKEREGFRPFGQELFKRLGLGGNEQELSSGPQQQQQQQPQQQRGFGRDVQY